MRFIGALVAFLSCVLVHAQTKIFHATEPTWVEQYTYNDRGSDSAGASKGYSYLLVSLQNHLETKEYYRKYVIKVMSEHGLSYASAINESFDPSYQKMIFHTLAIVRNGKRIDKMDINKLEVIRREEAMDRAVYDKSLNAVYNLPDVRVDDIIEYSFTIKGANPIFNGHTFGNLYMQYSVPVRKFAHKLIFDVKRPLHFKSHGITGTPIRTQKDKLESYDWVQENVPAVLYDDMVPSWYEPNSRIHYSDFKSWKEVKHWAYSIFNFKMPNSKKLTDLVQGIKESHNNEESKIKECIRIVQADIRYLSFSDGVHSHQPHTPGQVFEQKYGDCKDKSLLLSYLLNEIGIKSSPALVSTEIGYVLKDALPNPWAFDHCIVQFSIDDSTYWIDPTLQPQVGLLKHYFVPSYYNALVVNDTIKGLDSILHGFKNSKINVLEEYFMDKVGGDVILEVESQFYGDEADDIRRYMQTNSKDIIHKNYLNFYAKDFSEIELKNDVKFVDDKVNNLITSSEQYLLKNFWTVDADKKWTASVYARVLSSYLHKPETKLRTMPLRNTFPREVTQTIKVYLPEDWNIDNYQNSIESDGFFYNTLTSFSDRTITIDYYYKSKASFIEAKNSAEHIKKVDEVLDNLYYTIYKPVESTESPAGSIVEYLIVALLTGAFLYGLKKRFR